MSHIVGKSAFKSLSDRLNRFPQGAPPSETLYKILSILYSEKEAELVSKLPIKPFTAKTASKIWKVNEREAEKILEELSSRALLLDATVNGERQFTMPPPMAGFFEFAFMRIRDDIDQKLLAELFEQYLHVEEDFIKDLFLGTETRFGRVFVQEGILTNENQLEILDFERATHLIKSAKAIAVSMCYCRHKMHHLGYDCDKPMDVCLTFGNTANSLSKYEHARKIDIKEALEILELSYENNLVQCGENVQEDITFMCNCCGCCCEGMRAVKKFGALHPIATTGFIPNVEENCVGCGKCAKACPIDAIKIEKDSNGKRIAIIDKDVCLGCGVCVRNCSFSALKLVRREEKILTPVNTVHRVVASAIEKGTLADLIFDNKALFSHRAMAAVFRSILNLSPIQQKLASEQVKSIYLKNLIERYSK